jgi:hypothetical protein
MIPDTIKIQFWNKHPSGTRPGWRPVVVCRRETTIRMDRRGNEAVREGFFAINWRNKEIIVEWSRVVLRFDKRSSDE